MHIFYKDILNFLSISIFVTLQYSFTQRIHNKMHSKEYFFGWFYFIYVLLITKLYTQPC